MSALNNLPGSSWPPVQNGKEKRGGLILPADFARWGALATTTTQGQMSAADYASLQLLSDPPRARVYRTTDQTIASATFTALSFDGQRLNDGGGAGGALPWVGTSPTRLTAPNGGLYAIGGGVLWASTTGGARRQVNIRINGATIVNLAQVGNPAGVFAPAMVGVTLYPLAQNDYVELVVLQDSGGAVLVSTAANYSPEFWFWRICA